MVAVAAVLLEEDHDHDHVPYFGLYFTSFIIDVDFLYLTVTHVFFLEDHQDIVHFFADEPLTYFFAFDLVELQLGPPTTARTLEEVEDFESFCFDVSVMSIFM